MQFTDFETQARSAGLQAKKCSPYHWQLLGGASNPLVNVWPNSKRGFHFQTRSDQSVRGTIEDAICLAGPRRKETADDAPPWQESPTSERVGLIRWLWRWIW